MCTNIKTFHILVVSFTKALLSFTTFPEGMLFYQRGCTSEPLTRILFCMLIFFCLSIDTDPSDTWH